MTKLDNIIDKIKEKQLVWYGTVRTFGEGKLPKKALRWNPNGRKKRDRVKNCWFYGIL